MKVFENAAAVEAALGDRFGPSEWLTVDQDMIDRFADLTGDRQWIHIDVDRARREAPGTTTIAHGYLVLSLLGVLLPQLYKLKTRSILNYGIDKLRFLAPVASGSSIRLFATIKEVVPASGGYKVVSGLIFEVEGALKPAIAADIIFLCFD